MSSSRYRGGSVDARKVGKELNVHAVLAGSVRREEDHIRLTAQLIETRGGFHLWSETYDREVRDVLEVQREIAAAIARTFHIDLAGDRRALVRPHSADTEAYQFYLRAAHLAGSGDPESVTHSVEHYRMALARDSKYALAWAGLSLAHATMFDFGMGPWRGILANCRESALKAASLAPALAESQQAMGLYLIYGEWDWNGAARAFRRAMELDPSYIAARYEYARTMNVVGRHEEAIVELERGIELDPTANILWNELANSYIKARRYDEAAAPLAMARQLVKRSPANSTMQGMVAIGKEHYADAISHFEEAMRIRPGLVWPEAYLGYCHARLGRVAEASGVLKRLTAVIPNRALPEFEIGAIYAGLGQNDLAFEWLERAYRRRSAAMARINVDQRMQMLRSDPRFVSLLKRMRLAA
jgi:tetratricopeptide (TPR) repeat protein